MIGDESLFWLSEVFQFQVHLVIEVEIVVMIVLTTSQCSRVCSGIAGTSVLDSFNVINDASDDSESYSFSYERSRASSNTTDSSLTESQVGFPSH